MATGDPYVTADELGAHLRFDGPAEGESLAQLEQAVTATTRWVDNFTRRKPWGFNLATTASGRYFDVLRDGTVLTEDIGHATITIATDSAQDGTFATTWATTDFQVSPLGALAVGEPISSLLAIGSYTFPAVSRRRGLVRVTARWGWPAVPEDVKLATLIQGAKLYKRRDSAEGVLGGNDFGIVRVGSRIDPDAEDLLNPYRYLSVA